MLSFLILLLIFFILWPLLKAGWSFWRQMNRWNRFMADPEGEMRRQAARAGHSGQAPRKQRKKKIPRDVGEYVAFTEIEVSAEEQTRTEGSQTTSFKTEEQISDIKWVDIK